jgi:integrase
MANADVPELAKKVVKEFTLNDLIDAFLKIATVSESDRSRVNAFKSNHPVLCSKTLDQHGAINKGFDDYVEKKKKAVIVGYTASGKTVYGPAYTVTREMSPLRTMYRNAGSQKLYGLLDHKVTLRNAFEGIQFPKDVSHREQYLKPFQENHIFEAIEKYCSRSIEYLKWVTLVSMALITCLRRGVLLHLRWKDDPLGKAITSPKTL